MLPTPPAPTINSPPVVREMEPFIPSHSETSPAAVPDCSTTEGTVRNGVMTPADDRNSSEPAENVRGQREHNDVPDFGSLAGTNRKVDPRFLENQYMDQVDREFERPLQAPSQTLSKESFDEEEAVKSPRTKKHEHSRAICRKVKAIFTDWARKELQAQLTTLKLQVGLPEGSTEKLTLEMREWIKDGLRHKFRAYIQLFHDPSPTLPISKRGKKGKKINIPTGEAGITSAACGHPGCGKPILPGMYRVSFEPHAWTQPFDNTHIPSTTGEAFLDENFDPRNSNLPISLPNYEQLLLPVNVAKYDGGEVFCVGCFEDLLEKDPGETAPMQPPPLLPPITKQGGTKSKKRQLEEEAPTGTMWLRPSPIRRIYTSVFPETRYHPQGHFLLDEPALKVVKQWKQVLLAEGVKMLKEKYHFLKDSALTEDEDFAGIPMSVRE
ncbi:hypothetical protein BZA05DRAFT_436890 [Tricharina praecox]|uniref:uncharacterized protein n=1 Tax=Tricharina praecox TaxID=43433 RepID=UPI00221EEEB4|nr:uncharacterized protein BZA05DRAFT_436890 [Tricharina praecox]KAI5850094.1 hypothetical protein BZA05DRAFT_436890 [Tricharina praecox]